MPRSDEALLAVAALGVLCLGLLTAIDRPAPVPAPVPARPVAAAPAAAPVGRPVAVRIPALDLDEPLVPLGRQPDGSLEVPTDYGAVGAWGGDGPVVLAGHVDSDRGPAVFSRLHELRRGDRVVVRTTDGRLAAYVVERVEQHAKTAFPTFEVFTGDGLRLITCGGAFDRRAGSYRDNLVVHAVPA